MRLMERIKFLVLRSKLLTIIAAVITNYWTPLVMHLFPKAISNSGRSFEPFDVAETLSRFEEEYGRYARYGKLTGKSFKGKSVLEIGTGDNLLIALKCLAMGAKRVVTIDKFYCFRSEQEQARLYRAFMERLPKDQERNLAKAIRFTDGGFGIEETRLQFRQVAIEELDGKETFDMMLSNTVFEHVHDLPRAFRIAKERLNPKGLFIAYIGWPDHGLFSVYHHPLYYLRICEPLWWVMTAHCGRVNRKHTQAYRKVLETLGFKYTILIARLKMADKDLEPFVSHLKQGKHYTKKYLAELKELQKGFAPQFRNLSDEDLMTERIFIRAVRTT